MPFNPFDKPHGQPLAPDDLQSLIKHEVSEGYYVEFKGEFVSNEKIAKGVSALANTYGGWFIIGVTTDGHNVAHDICGFSLVEIKDPVDKLREVVKSWIDPAPLFFPQVVEIGDNKAVLLVYVPEGQETPYRTKDGKIFRRVADSSDPVQETNRYAIDRLVDAGHNPQRDFEQFCQDTRGFSKADDERQCWVNVFISPYPLGLFQQRIAHNRADLEALLESASKQVPVPLAIDWTITAGMKFSCIQPTHQSVILRITDPDAVATNWLSVELFHNGRAKFHIPLQYVDVYGRGNTVNTPEIRYLMDRLIETNRGAANIASLRFFDVGMLWLNIAVLMGLYRDWLGEQPWLTDLRVAVSAAGAWRTVPFIDATNWASHVERFGLPVVTSSRIQIPDPISAGMFLDATNPQLWIAIAGWIGLGFGLPSELQSESFGQTVARLAANSSPGSSR